MKILKNTLIFLLPVWSLFSCSKNDAAEIGRKHFIC